MTALYGYPGLITQIVRGDTIPLRYDLVDTDRAAIDVTGGQVVLMLSTNQPGAGTDLEVVLSPATPAEGLFTGAITDTETFALIKGKYYYSIQYIDSAGQAFLMDIGYISIYDGINPRIAQ